MNFNKKRHKTLKILSKKRIQFDSGQMESGFILGIDFKDLQSELNSDRNTCELIFAPLYNEKEVEFTDVGVEGLFLTQKGLTSFSQKKYIKENERIILSWFKVFVQIVIPILSLIVAILALSIKINNLNSKTSEKIHIIEKKMKSMQNTIDSLEIKHQINVRNIKTELSDYKDTELLEFYQDFKNVITEIIWIDETPAKLSGVIFKINEKKYFEIRLDLIPKSFKMDEKRNWKLSEVGNSRVQNIKLIEH